MGDLLHGVSGDPIMPKVISEFLELIEDHQVLTTAAKFPTLVENFLDVRLSAWCRDNFISHIAQPFKAFLAHAFGKNGYGLTSK